MKITLFMNIIRILKKKNNNDKSFAVVRSFNSFFNLFSMYR